mgnify:CR=1 FL=1
MEIFIKTFTYVVRANNLNPLDVHLNLVLSLAKQEEILQQKYWLCCKLSCNRGYEFPEVSELKVTWSMINTVIKIEEIFGWWMISENGKKCGQSCCNTKIKIRTKDTASMSAHLSSAQLIKWTSNSTLNQPECWINQNSESTQSMIKAYVPS